MIIDINIVCMGDGIYASKVKHEKLGLLKSIVEAKSFSAAKTKINANLKQMLWKKGISSKDSPITFHFNALDLEKHQIPLEQTPNEFRKYHPDYLNQKEEEEDPRIYSLEEIIDEHGKSSWRTVKHDSPLMNKKEIQMALMAKIFA